MPSLPWKKAKAKAISIFVVDRLQSSSKHGVVETGFPTSVVDLFVKNRDRFKKPPSSSSSSIKKISKSSSSSKRPTPLDLIPVSAPPLSSPTPLLFSPDSRIPSTFLPPPTVVQPQQQEGDGVCQGDCDSTMLFLAMLKMFFVVLLAFATSKFVVGITLSAFLLVFMEYAGKHLCRLFFFSSKPQPKSSSSSDDDESSPQCMCMINKALSSLSFHKSFHCFMGFLGIKNNLFSPQHAAQEQEEEKEEEEDFKAPPCHQQQQQQDTKTATPPPHEHTTTTTTREYSNNNNNDEIETETETSVPNLVPRPRRRIPCVASEPDLLNWANREQLAAAEQQEERNDVVFHKEAAAYTSCDDFSESSSSSDLKKRTSRRGKIKSKIKRLVSGNLKNKKRNNGSSSGGNNKSALFSSISLDEDKLNSMMSYSSSSNSSSRRRMEHVKVNHQFGAEGDDDHRSMSSSTGGDNGICFSNELSRGGTEDAGTNTSSSVILREEEGEPTASNTRRNSSSAACLIFFAMVLVGLVGGRTLAIAFTLSWCLLLKSSGILKCRKKKNV